MSRTESQGNPRRAELLKPIEALEASAAGSVHEEERGNNRHNHQKIAFGVSKLLTRPSEDGADKQSDPKEDENCNDQLKDVKIENHTETLQEVINKDRPISANQIAHSGILPESGSR
jgi:hypothetical protein